MTFEGHHAPALWLVVALIAVVTAVGTLVDVQLGAVLLAATLAGAAAARLVLRGRRPEGVAVRSTWADVTVLTALAVGIGVLATSPGV
ncbi:DUF3017 domain-containing protein [Actinotalea sp.]|uniref:DUF3017 domain-containing protein n=1 Tax=Actinotalea sp. TaxID=1872145 RepID=UPI002CE63F84|nr:DUF3017 domain-containing protein [Actinotalea sp.]HQY33913.1 DUF3017 domain-containing protein [Actinotalea sp.]HRA50609.1 DUF3017 domain-containing protein [Actinotalea sp.]